MSVRPALDSLPLEITTAIASHIKSEDRRNLRLVARQLAHHLYPEMPTSKTLATTKSDLNLLVAMTGPQQPGCLLQCLKLVEIVGEHDRHDHWCIGYDRHGSWCKHEPVDVEKLGGMTEDEKKKRCGESS